MIGEAKRRRGSPKVRPDGYVRRTIEGNRKLLHVWVWLIYNGPVPKGWQIHHKNGNRADNKISNLQLITPLGHRRKHCGHTQNKKGVWFKPCSACGKTKNVLTDFYARNAQCKPCFGARTRSKRLKRVNK